MSRGEVMVSSLKGVLLLSMSVTFLLSVLIWTLPGEISNKKNTLRLVTERGIFVNGKIANKAKKTRLIIHRAKKSLSAKEICISPKPSKSDLNRLRSRNDTDVNSVGLYENIYNKRVFCFLETDCSGNTVLSVKCQTQGCSGFIVKREHSEVPVYNVSPESLEGIIGLQGKAATHIKVLCHDGKPPNDRKDNWQTLVIKHRIQQACKEDSVMGSRHIHIINIRFLSRWELLTRMKRLAALVSSEIYEGSKIYDFPKYQSLAWYDIDNLALLLQGHPFSNKSNSRSIIDVAKEQSMNIRLFDLSEEDYQRTLNLRRVVRNDDLNCLNSHLESNNIYKEIPACNCSIYLGSEAKPEEKLAYLTTCLSAANNIASSDRLLTLTFLESNKWDHSFDETVDLALTNIIKNIISSDNQATVVLLSDIGNPTYSHFDSSLFLQTQSSNPFLFIFYPTSSKLNYNHFMLAENRDRLISLQDIHATISDFLSPDARVYSKSKHEDATNQYEGLSLCGTQIPHRPNLFHNVQSPNLGVCESGNVPYTNDTIQVAFAEAAVGLINNYIQERTKISGKIIDDNSRKCFPFVGDSFMNVRKSYKDGVIMTTMDLRIRLATTRNVKHLKGVVLKIKNSLLGNETVLMESLSSNIDKIIETQLLPLACSHKLNVNISLIPSAEISLILAKARSFGTKPRIMPLHGRCLFLVFHGFKDTVAYYVLNACADREYDFSFGGTLINVVSIMPLPVKLHLIPGQSYYVTSFVKSSYFVKEYSFHYDTHFDLKFL